MRSLVVLLLIGLLVLNVFLVRLLPATFFPEQDTGILIGQIIADQSISFTAMEKKLAQLQAIVQKDPAVASVAGFTGGRALNTANVFIELKPLAQRQLSATEVVNRLRPKLNAVSGARLFMQAQQDLRIGGRQSAAEYQYTMTSDDASALFKWVPKLVTELGKYRGQLEDVNSDLQQNGLQTYVNISRATATRYGFQPNQIDNVLYDAFGQRTVSTIYNALNQYFVVMEVAPEYWQYPQTLNRIFLSTAAGNPSGTQQTQMPGGTVSRVTQRSRREQRVEHEREHELAECRRRSEPADQQHLEQQGRQFQRQRGQHGGRNDGAAARDGDVLEQPHRDAGEPPERARRRRRFRSTCRPNGSLSEAGSDHRAGRARHRHARLDPRRVRGRRAGLRAVDGRRAAADPRGARWSSTSCSACCTRTRFTRSRSSRRCHRPASARRSRC